jgi:hypothetical protein
MWTMADDLWAQISAVIVTLNIWEVSKHGLITVQEKSKVRRELRMAINTTEKRGNVQQQVTKRNLQS